ncbi:Hpt domain-containing protein [Ralstonia mannitolilytica]|nr:Hpt domain-containing protein [Ralstonia mannitolilytica]
MSEARAAIEASDYGRAAKSLHFIKGGFAVVGEVSLTEASHALETLLLNGGDRDAILTRLQGLVEDAERMFAKREPVPRPS